MASIIITSPALVPGADGTLLSDPDFDAKLLAGMMAFGEKFSELYLDNDERDDALVDTFLYIEGLLDSSYNRSHLIYGIGPLQWQSQGLQPVVTEL